MPTKFKVPGTEIWYHNPTSATRDANPNKQIYSVTYTVYDEDSLTGTFTETVTYKFDAYNKAATFALSLFAIFYSNAKSTRL